MNYTRPLILGGIYLMAETNQLFFLVYRQSGMRMLSPTLISILSLCACNLTSFLSSDDRRDCIPGCSVSARHRG